MTPEENGRHCAQCCKTVVDFTEWETGEIIAYLQANSRQEVCGRIIADRKAAKAPTRKQQLKAIWKSAAPVYKRIAAVIILFFSVENAGHAQVKAQPTPKAPQNQHVNDPVIMGGIPAPVKRDTPVHKRIIMGKPAPIRHKPTSPGTKVVRPAAEPQPVIEQGKMLVSPPGEK